MMRRKTVLSEHMVTVLGRTVPGMPEQAEAIALNAEMMNLAEKP